MTSSLASVVSIQPDGCSGLRGNGLHCDRDNDATPLSERLNTLSLVSARADRGGYVGRTNVHRGAGAEQALTPISSPRSRMTSRCPSATRAPLDGRVLGRNHSLSERCGTMPTGFPLRLSVNVRP